MTENNSFVSFDNNQKGLLYDDSNHPNYPIRYYNVISGDGFKWQENCSYYGYVYEGYYTLNQEGSPAFLLKSGMYFSISKEFEPVGDGKMIIIEVLHDQGDYPLNNYSAVTTVGGEIEERGRLKYIDGCTDSLLIPPVKMGDPCFNHLHFPDHITQTPHTHPTHRIGIVAKGNGKCVTPFGNLPLTSGMIFIIKEWDGSSIAKGKDGLMHPVGTHKFDTKNESMDVIAFHPDSDFGPTDIEHPMINRTIVNGVKASELEDIRTK